VNIRYRVELSQAERDELKGLLSGGRHAARKLKRAQILLAADARLCKSRHTVWSTYLPGREAIDIAIMCHRQDLSGATNSKSISSAYLWAAEHVREMFWSTSTLS
jgi:hypothetical protein